MAAPTTTYRMWKRLAAQPGGTQLFSAPAMVRVPYFASIVPHVVRMEPGYAEVAVPKWFFVKTIGMMPLLLTEGHHHDSTNHTPDHQATRTRGRAHHRCRLAIRALRRVADRHDIHHAVSWVRDVKGAADGVNGNELLLARAA